MDRTDVMRRPDGRQTARAVPSGSGGGRWGSAAADWAEIQEASIRPLFVEVLDRSIKLMSPAAVLDVACGTGLFCALAHARGIPTVAGIDASAGQLRVARERAPAVLFCRSRMHRLPFHRRTFDLVTCCNGLQYADDAVLVLREFERVLSARGMVGILTHSLSGPPDTGIPFELLYSYPGVRQPEGRGAAVFREVGALERFLDASGLAPVTDAEVSCDWNYPDFSTAVRGIVSSGPGSRALEIVGFDRVAGDLKRVLRRFASADGSYQLSRTMRYVLCVRANAQSGNR